ncbi:MAG: alpha/beta fold hydrolase [Patescibacteria group bacterium]
MEENRENVFLENTPEQKSPRKNKILISIFLLITILVLGAGIYAFSTRTESKILLSSTPESEKKNNISPAPFPFQELTIPYLRSRDYKSELEEFEKVSQNANYTSYMTSYDSDGLRIDGQLTIPTGTQPIEGFPAVVFVHGYIPPENYQTLGNYSAYVDYLAKNGFVVFKIDLRGHADSQGEPGGAYYSSDYIIDTLNAHATLQDSDFVNPDKIGLWGHSMAGNVVSRALASKPDIPAISIWSGAVYTYEDFSQFSIEDNSYRPPSQDSEVRRKRNELFEKYGQFDSDSDFWKQVPMTNYLSDIKGAIQLNHAVDDDVVDIRYSRNFNEILNKTEIVHELNEYSSGGHNISGSAFNQAMTDTVEFFKENL